MTVRSLLSKLADRARRRKRQLRLFEKDGKVGHRVAAARDGRAMRKLRKLIAKARRLQPTLAGVELHSTALGRKHWGGGADIMGQFVAPFMLLHYGLRTGSKKRTPQHNAEIGGSPTSDHLTTRVETFACDFPTFDGEAAARALAAAFGYHDWQANSYDTFDFECGGHTFRLQILWGAGIDHGDHVHVGIELIT
jgi:hypothetical protein